MSRIEAPCGTWDSPITPELLVADAVRLGGVAIDGVDDYWLEGRPLEGGRNVLVAQRAGEPPRDVTPPGFNVRTRVHEYGGGAFLVREGTVWFCNFDNQRIYSQEAGGEPDALTPAGPYRYADMRLDATRQRLICVREHHGEGWPEPQNELVAISLKDGSATVLHSGHSFYASPALSPDGRKLAWLCWDHPFMPWDSAALKLADVMVDGGLTEMKNVCGGEGEAVFQPCWSPNGVLHFVTDPHGWWNVHCFDGARISCVMRMDAEFARAQWQFGMTTFAFLSETVLLCMYQCDGDWHLCTLDTHTHTRKDLDCPYTAIDGFAVSPRHVLLVAASPEQVDSVVKMQLDPLRFAPVRLSVRLDIAQSNISKPRTLTYPSKDGALAHAFFYPPCNERFVPMPDERPPVIVVGHGGPTAATSSGLRPAIQFWTSRGFAVLDVNYRGSTGYGRAYREALKGNWGIVDVDDCAYGVKFLVTEELVDGERAIIRGSSAGGYTTLAALTFHDTFKAGASYYGISELESLAQETHKFESRYLDQLIGPYPQAQEVYIARSPISATDKLSCPIIFFQGLEDKVVPPNQAQSMVDAMRARNLPVAYLAFEGEQHGFRKAATITRTLEAELYFYGRVFGFAPAGDLAPIEIFGLD